MNTEYFISIKLSVKGTHQKLVFTEFERGPEKIGVSTQMKLSLKAS